MNVYVLGAGASMHAGYPLCGRLASQLTEWLEGRAEELEPSCDWVEPKAIRELFPLLDDFEGILSELYEPTSHTGVLGLGEIASKGMFRGIVEALCGYFDSIRAQSQAKLYQVFAQKHVVSGDVLVTFNYDLALERELHRAGKWEASDGFGFEIEIDNLPRSSTTVLKLHGSTGWHDLLFRGRENFSIVTDGALGPRPVIFPLDLEYLGYKPGTRDPHFNGGSVSRSGSMIPPVTRKRFHVDSNMLTFREREPFWNDLWGQAEAAISKADTIAIIGYSLPSADERARELLLHRSNKDAGVTICCGPDSDRLREEFLGCGFNVECGGPSTFEKWLA
jgi:hypothetical protein